MIQRWRTLPPYWRRVTLRLALLPLILFVLYSAVFLFLEVIYEPFTDGYIGLGGTEEQLEAIREEFGLNDSAWTKYQDFWRSVFTMDFGPALTTQRPVRDILQDGWPSSLQLAAMATIIGVTVALATAGLARVPAARPAMPVVVSLLAAVPVFYITYEAVQLPVEWWGYAPPIGRRVDFFSDPWENLKQFGHAAISLGTIAGVWSSRVARSFIDDSSIPLARRLAAAAGVAAIDMLPVILTGIVLVEWIFTIPGIGSLMFRGGFLKDVPALETSLVLFGFLTVLAWSFAPAVSLSVNPLVGAPLRALVRRPLVVAGSVIAAAYVILGIVGPWIAPYDPLVLSGRDEVREMPSWDHWFGTDYISRDTLSLVLDGNRGALEFTLFVIGAGFLPGIILGRLATSAAKRAPVVSDVLYELTGLVRALPVLPLLFMMVVALDHDRSSTVAAVAILTFASGLQVAVHPGFTPASLAGGLAMAAAVSVSAHAIIGALRLDNDFASWGAMVATPFQHTPVHHAAAVFPALAITIFTAGFLLIRTALDDLDPPRLHER